MKIRKRLHRALGVLGASCVSLGVVGAASAAITIATVPVGNVANAADTTGFGSVAYNYNIATTDVTAGQYTAFLNAVAKTDTYGLYNTNMATGFAACGITQSGSSGNFTYTTTKNASFPANYTTWGDAARFSNWLSNNQPTGAEGNGTTETGSYTLNGATSDVALNAITRNANANYVIPTENEWYKAAYYNPSTSSYDLYPTESNSQPSNVLSATGTNNANYYNNGYTDPTNYLTAVGAFAASSSPYGTFDQGGDVFQWNESVFRGSFRGLRGGSFPSSSVTLQSGYNAVDTPSVVLTYIGFRLSQVPEPASMGLLSLGVVAMLVRRRAARR